ncbi:multidrug resistance protein 1 [[Candida] anglica]|uniref:Multidrug resistance protein 1 n=1 Tax=[Candida] anglica TaxID=148631 RepID=A0ABP0EHF8_9ASCO
MHFRFIRDSFWGRLAYHLSSHRVFSHPEEHKDYVISEKYLFPPSSSDVSKESLVEAADTPKSEPFTSGTSNRIVVDWDGDDDPENPYNWPVYQKIFFIFEIAFLTTSVYMASAIYTPGIDEIMSEWGISRVQATLPLSLFVIGYGIGPMVLSPFSENATIGRTSIYIITLFIFFILQIPTALAPNIASLCVLRLIGGFFASAALATGGASVGDMVRLPYIPIGLGGWSLGTVCGPSLGPLVGSIFAQLVGWRWTFWFMVILSGASFLVLSFLLPESYGHTLLYRKAQRLRALTQNENIISAGEIENMNVTTKEMVVKTLWRPIEISLFEPVVLLINIYIAMVYSVMYLWFEAFPIVFLEIYHFNLIEMGVSYVGVMVGVLIAGMIYLPITYKSFSLKIIAGEEVAPEVFLPVAIFGSVCMPIGLFIFGWSATPSAHWIGPIIGTAIFCVGAFIIFQTLFNYLSFSFWKYIASVFAGNVLFRSVLAGVFPLFGAPLFNNLATEKYPVAWGSSLLAFICVGMIAIPVLFYMKGPAFRTRSKYSGN